MTASGAAMPNRRRRPRYIWIATVVLLLGGAAFFSLKAISRGAPKIDPEKLARQVDFLDRNPEYVGCGGGYVVVDQHGKKRGMFLKPENDAAIRSRALLANPIANSTAVFRRMIKGEPALYDLAMRGFADWDFWLSAATCGAISVCA
jgi:hypothetical protein